MTERILVPNTPRVASPAASRSSSSVMGFISLHAVLLVGEPLVDLEERDDLLLLPQVLGGGVPSIVAVHRLLEQDRAEDAVAVERRRS